jgi:hypothetical protein
MLGLRKKIPQATFSTNCFVQLNRAKHRPLAQDILDSIGRVGMAPSGSIGDGTSRATARAAAALLNAR